METGYHGGNGSPEINRTWDLVQNPKEKIPVESKWVFTIKYKVDRLIERYKVRLVAKGYTQIYGIDYYKIFAPVIKLNIVRVLFVLTTNLDWTPQ